MRKGKCEEVRFSVKRSTKGHWDKHWQREKAKFEKGYILDAFRKSVDVLTGLVDIKGKKVLEVGAGSGMDSIRLAMRGADAYVLDYSDEALHITGILAKNFNTYPQRVKADAKALPFANESFDMVFHVGLLEHFVAPVELLREQRRILKPNGYLLVDVPQRYTLYTTGLTQNKVST